MLRNPIYCGLIYIPPYKDEGEKTVKGIHEPLISENTFYRVQDFLDGRKRNVPTKNTRREELPLRGFLFCSKCGKKLSGSASTGGSGIKHFYYHCKPGCPERIKAPEANMVFLGWLEQIKFNEVSVDYLQVAVEQIFKENQLDKSLRSKRIKVEIEKLRTRLNNAQVLMLDGEMKMDEYREIKIKTEPEIERMEREYMQLPVVDSDYEVNIEFGLNTFQHLTDYWKLGDVTTKQALVGSLFPEKLYFSEMKCRTEKMNEALEHICPQIKELCVNKNGTEACFSPQSHKVIPLGFEPRTPTLKV